MTKVVEEGLRFILAGPSIVSDWKNPSATTNRAVMTALIELGHEATYLEPRFDPALVALLEARGAEPLRPFLAAYPRLRYRTVELPPEPFQAASWAGQFLSTASASVVLAGCPVVIEDGFRQFPGCRCPVPEGADGRDWLSLDDGDAGPTVTSYRPAVFASKLGYAAIRNCSWPMTMPSSRAGWRTWCSQTRGVVSGSADLSDWEWVSEVDLSERYGKAERVLIVDGAEETARRRGWLARSRWGDSGVTGPVRPMTLVMWW
ncbi:MAG: hypothetical protein R2848_15235 [Thermomicrobiales bacterium]